MSGIVALVSLDSRPACSAEALSMLNAIPYRGPDGAFARAFGQAVLGHARMAVRAADRSEIQPLVSSRSGCAIVADVRLDNRIELSDRLELPREASDARMILAAYEQWGLACARYLRGDFAFAIWDAARRRLLCARDAGGQRALFYRADSKTFAAASEIHQLLQNPAVPLEPDDARIRSALLPVNRRRNPQEHARTYYKGIRSLLPGYQLVLTPEHMDVHCFAQLERPPSIRYKHSAEYVEHFRHLLFQAVSERTRTDTHLGALLSGGLDSSSLVATVQELYRSGAVPQTPFTTFSAVYDGLECDEQSLIRDLRQRYDFDARYVAADPAAELSHLQPNGFRDRPEIMTLGTASVFDAAQDAGVRVLLTGELADNYLRGGLLVFDSLLRQGKLRELMRYVRAYRAQTCESLLRTAAVCGVAPLLPLPIERWAMTRFLERQDRLERWRMLPFWIPDPMRETLLDENSRGWLAEESRRVFNNHMQHHQYLNLQPPECSTVPSGWSLEIWRPFAARSLQEFALAIPPEHLYDPLPGETSPYGASKQLLRRSMRGMLPESIRLRTNQTHFTDTFNQRLKREWNQYTATFGPRGQSHVARLGYIDPSAFWERLQVYRAGERGPDFPYVSYIVALETWLRNMDAPRACATSVATRAHAAPAVLLVDEHIRAPQLSTISVVRGSGLPANSQ